MNNKKISRKKSFVLPWIVFLFFILPLAGIADTFANTDKYEPGCGHLRGFIYKPDGETPLFGAQVVLQDVETRRVFRSNVTDSRGDYELLDVPAGNYVVLILSQDKIYKIKRVDFLIKIIAGKTTTISFALKKSGKGFLFFLLDPCCEALIVLIPPLIPIIPPDDEQSPTQR